MTNSDEATRLSIFTTVLEHARLAPVDDVPLEEIAARVDTSVDEVRRYGASTHEILHIAIADMLTALADAHEIIVASDDSPIAAGVDAEVAILSHVVEFAPVYRAESSRALWRTLTQLLREHLLGHLRADPSSIPLSSANDRDVQMLAAFNAAGTTAAMEVWLQNENSRDIEEAVGVIFASTPQWWLTPGR